MATTVQTLINQIADMVLEDTSLSSGLWAVSEVIHVIHDVSYDFLFKTGILKKVDAVTAVAGTRSYAYPSDAMELDRIAFLNVALYRSTRLSLDRTDRAWRTKSGRPKRYHLDDLSIRTFEVDQAPTAAHVALSNLQVVYTLLPSEVTTVDSNLSVPDHAVMYIKYGVLEHMLNKEGEGQDLARARYCHMRYMRGVNLYRRLMGKPPIEEQGQDG